MWGSSELVSSLEVITVAQIEYAEEKYGIQLEHSYLNHRINSPKTTVAIDGNITDWESNTDALFVGSESQAQITLQSSHDDENVYFLINRLDSFITSDDTFSVNIGAGQTSFFTVTADVYGNVKVTSFVNGIKSDVNCNAKAVAKVFGTVDNNKDKDVGYIIEIKVTKDTVGLKNAASYLIRPELINVDGGELVINDNIVAMSNHPYFWNIVVEKGGKATINGGVFSKISGDGAITIGDGAKILEGEYKDTEVPLGYQTVAFHSYGGNDKNDGITAATPKRSLGNLSGGGVIELLQKAEPL